VPPVASAPPAEDKFFFFGFAVVVVFGWPVRARHCRTRCCGGLLAGALRFHSPIVGRGPAAVLPTLIPFAIGLSGWLQPFLLLGLDHRQRQSVPRAHIGRPLLFRETNRHPTARRALILFGGIFWGTMWGPIGPAFCRKNAGLTIFLLVRARTCRISLSPSNLAGRRGRSGHPNQQIYQPP